VFILPYRETVINFKLLFPSSCGVERILTDCP
jgi:hypothetical protein